MGGRIGRHKRVPATVSRKQAHELADFVVVTIEAEKPGTMQYLDYSLKILDSSVVYIPQTIWLTENCQFIFLLVLMQRNINTDVVLIQIANSDKIKIIIKKEIKGLIWD